MSSCCYLTVEDGYGLNAETWAAFTTENKIIHSPNTVGGRTWYAEDVEVHFDVIGDDWCVTFGTTWMGRAMPEVARLGVLAWLHFGGSMVADLEIRRLIISGSAQPARD